MATNFPAAIDSFVTRQNDAGVTETSDPSVIWASIVNNLQDAVSALEAKVGVNSSTVAGTVDKRLFGVESGVNSNNLSITAINATLTPLSALVGVAGSTIPSTHDYLIKLATNPGHTHTGAAVTQLVDSGSVVRVSVSASGDVTSVDSRRLVSTRAGTGTVLNNAAGNVNTPPTTVLAAGSNDLRGSFTFGTGDAPQDNQPLVTLSFAQAYAAVPVVVVTPTTYFASYIQVFVVATTTGFSLYSLYVSGVPSQPNSTFGFSYFVMG